MRLAFVIFTYFPYGGLQRDMLSIAQAAVARGHQVTVFCKHWQVEKPADINVVEVAAKMLFDIAGVKGFVDAFIKIYPAADFDCLIGFNKIPGLDYYFCGDSCYFHKAYMERNWLYRKTPRAKLYLDYERAVFGENSNTQIFSLVKTEQKLFAKYYSTQPERFTLLPPGISAKHIACTNPESARIKLRKKLNLSVDTKIILCLGSGFHTKGVDISIASVAAMLKARKLAGVNITQDTTETALLIVGGDSTETYRQQAEKLGIGKKVIFLGPIDSVGDLLHSVDLLLHPARQELAGNVLLEAMLCGCPVLATASCGFAHYVVDAKLGCLIDTPANPIEIATTIESLLAIDKRIWREHAKQFAQDKSLFGRAQIFLDKIEEDYDLTNSPTKRKSSLMTFNDGYTSLILRDESCDWFGEDTSEPYSDAQKIAAIFSHVKNLTGEVAREIQDRQTLRFEVGGKGYYRKWHSGVGWKEIVKNLLQARPPILGAKNEWAALNKLRALAVPSIIPLAYGRRGRNPAEQESFIITRELSGVIQLDHFFSQKKVKPRLKWQIIDKVAHIARELHAAGINHRDFYLCHFMLREKSGSHKEVDMTLDSFEFENSSEFEIYLMDLHRAQLRITVPERWRVKDLGGLLFSALNMGFTQRDYWRFARAYFSNPSWTGDGCSENDFSKNKSTKSVRHLSEENTELFHKIFVRARKTYKRDFGVYPALNVSRKC